MGNKRENAIRFRSPNGFSCMYIQNFFACDAMYGTGTGNGTRRVKKRVPFSYRCLFKVGLR